MRRSSQGDLKLRFIFRPDAPIRPKYQSSTDLELQFMFRPGAPIRLKYQSPTDVVFRFREETSAIGVVVDIGLENDQDAQWAENFLMPIVRDVAENEVETVLKKRYGGEYSKVYRKEFRPGLRGRKDFAGLTREQFLEGPEIMEFRALIRIGLAVKYGKKESGRDVGRNLR